MSNDPLANALSNVMNAEKVSKTECFTKPASKIILAVLDVMKDHKYIGNAEVLQDGKGDVIKINLLGHINKVGVIKPRFSIKKDEIEKFEKRYLPAKLFGLLIISTSKGVMSHIEAQEKELGGKLLAFVY